MNISFGKNDAAISTSRQSRCGIRIDRFTSLLERIQRRGIRHELWIEAAYLERLNEAYINFFYRYSEAPLLIVNAADIDFAHNEHDYRLLLEQIVQNRGGRHYFNPGLLAPAGENR